MSVIGNLVRGLFQPRDPHGLGALQRLPDPTPSPAPAAPAGVVLPVELRQVSLAETLATLPKHEVGRVTVTPGSTGKPKGSRSILVRP